MPSNQEQNERWDVCLPSTLIHSARAFYAFDDDGSDNSEERFAHICVL